MCDLSSLGLSFLLFALRISDQVISGSSQLQCSRLWVFMEQLHMREALARPVPAGAKKKHKQVSLPPAKEE